MAAPCYLCGKSSELEGLCADCYNSEHPLIQVEHTLRLVICRRCESVKVPGGWKTLNVANKDSDAVLEDQLRILVKQNVKKLVKDVEIFLDIVNQLDRVLHTIFVAQGHSHPSLPPHEENYEVEVRISYETCITCSMMSGGYHEAILQIRADERPVTEEEEAEMTAVVTEITVAQYGKDTRAYVTGTRSDRFGIDYWIGSEHLCRKIADHIESKYLASRKQNYKLVGQDKGGKKKYRITILLRLPRYSIGDFILVEGNPCLVLSMGSGGLSCFDLVERGRFTINPKSVKWRSIEYLAPSTDRREFMIVSHVIGQPVQIMDNKTFEMADIDENLFGDEVPVGETIQVLVLEDSKYFPLPVESTES